MTYETNVESTHHKHVERDSSIAADIWKPSEKKEQTQQPSKKTDENGAIEITPIFDKNSKVKQENQSKPESSSEAVEKQPQAPATQAEKRDWTVIVNLTTNMPVRDPRIAKVNAGADNKIEQLKELAESTKGKSLSIVAQVTEKNPEHKKNGSDSEFLVKRYMIQDGTFKEIEQKKSEGPQKDLEGLISTATKNAPSEKIALIEQGHGGGARGLKQDNGKMTLDQFQDALKDGLKNSGHDKFDVVDFDSCLMGQDTVMSKMSSIAKEIVASEETTATFAQGPESKKIAADSQNLKDPLKKLIENTKMSGDDLANTFIQSAKDGANDGTTDNGRNVHGTDTLAHYDTENAQKLKPVVDKFGAALADSINDPDNRKVMEELIKETPRMVAKALTEQERDGYENRDLKQFAEKVQEAIDQGRLKDPSGQLKKSAQNVVTALGDTVENKFAKNDKLKYEDMGGLSVFLPSDTFRDSMKQAKLQTPLTIYNDITHKYLEMAKQDHDSRDSLQGISNGLEIYFKGMLKEITPEQKRAMVPLQKELDAIKSSKTVEQFCEHLEKFAKKTQEMTDSKFNEELAKSRTPKIREKHREIFEEQKKAAGDNSEWMNFLKALGPLTKTKVANDQRVASVA